MKKYHQKYGVVTDFQPSRVKSSDASFDRRLSILRLIIFVAVMLYEFWFVTKPLPSEVDVLAVSPIALAKLGVVCE